MLIEWMGETRRVFDSKAAPRLSLISHPDPQVRRQLWQLPAFDPHTRIVIHTLEQIACQVSTAHGSDQNCSGGAFRGNSLKDKPELVAVEMKIFLRMCAIYWASGFDPKGSDPAVAAAQVEADGARFSKFSTGNLARHLRNAFWRDVISAAAHSREVVLAEIFGTR